MDANPRQISRSLISGVAVAGLFLLGSVAGCKDEQPLQQPSDPAPAASAPAGERTHFFDDFDSGAPTWEAMAGAWDLSQKGSVTEYAPVRRGYALSYAGNPNWSNYRVSAKVTIDDDRQGQSGIVGRGDSDHYYFELVLGRDPQGQKSWSIRQRTAHRWTTLATGPFDYALGTPYLMRLSFSGRSIEGSISGDGGRSFDKMGAVEAAADSWQVGRFGVVTYGGGVRFDDVAVTSDGEVTIALVDTPNGWGPLVLIRDDTDTFTNAKPTGGWYVTPIHVTLRPDGKVLVTGFSRKGASGCTNGSGGTQRENGMTWILDPALLDLGADNSTLQAIPINEQNWDPVHDVLYCAGHSPMADGRVYHAAGTRYPSTLPNSSPERGLRYSRIFDTTGLTRVGANGNSGIPHLTTGGQNDTYPTYMGDGGTVRGEKWYPTTVLLGDGNILTYGGFHWSGGGPGSKANNSFELHDTLAWDLNHATNPYTVLTQHVTTGLPAQLPPTRGYSNMMLLPKPVPAGLVGMTTNPFAGSVIIYGGRGKVALFNPEPGPFTAPDDVNRVFAGSNSLTISPDGTPANERAEGGSGVLLSDGRIMIFNGGHTADGSRRAYVYNPYADTWHGPSGAVCPAGSPPSCSLDLTVSRMYGQAVQLPDGKVMVINGYGAQSGNGAAFEEDGNENDIPGAFGDPRQPVLVDPYANPMIATPQSTWLEATHRGYHSVSLLLKDGRILTGGGKDKTHFTGCEKNELRIYTPPYLRGNPTRPVVSNIAEGQNIQVGSGVLRINHTGTLRADRPVALVALGSLTHAFDMGQRYVPLTVVPGAPAGSVDVRVPATVNVAQPGYYNLFVINSAGTPSMGITVKLTPPSTCVYSLNGTNQYIEAEGRSRGDGLSFAEVSDPGRSNEMFMHNVQGSGTHTSVPDEGKVLWFDLNVTTGGNYFIWALANGPDTSADTMWISLDASPDQTLTLPTPVNTWGWVRLSATATNITAGKHTLKIKVREDGAMIDKLAFTTSAGFTPSGTTDPALTCNALPLPPPPTGVTSTPGNGQITVSWTTVTGALPGAPPNSITYTLKRSTAQGGPYSNVAGATNITATTFTDTGVVNGTNYFYVVTATNPTGESNKSDEVSGTPMNWTATDVGAVGLAGSTSRSGNTYTVRAAGADIFSTTDAFHFLHMPLPGDGSITARILSLSGGDGNNVKAGVMMRAGTGASDGNGYTMIKPASTQNKFQRRLTSGGTTTSTLAAVHTYKWVRLTRTGNTLLSQHSPNGTTWTTIATDTVTMSNVKMGLAVTGHTTTALTTVVFDNVTVTGAIVNAPPTVATPAAASPAPAPGTTTALSALGADDGGEAALTYTWSTTGSPPAPVTFSANGTNAAKNTTATFTKAGNYSFQVVIQDAGGLTVTSSVSMTVSQTLTSIVVAPASASVPTGGTQQFTATARDQFATALTSQPSFTWMVAGGGTISTGGLFTAGGTPGGPFSVMATSGAVNGTAEVTVIPPNEPPTVATAASASPAPAPGTTTALSVLGADDAGEAALVYTWSTTGMPPAAVSFSANGTNAAKNVTAMFTKAGNYSFQVEIKDAGNLTVTSPVSMTVSETFTSIVVAPASANVVTSGTQQFTATAQDQFATALTSQPSFSWMVSGGGTISTGGLFTAGATPGGPFTVTATSGAINGTAQVTVTSGTPAAPSNLAATIVTGNQANLTWTDNSNNETGFLVERKVGGGAYATLATKGIDVTSHNDTGLTPNTYTYRVIATGSPNSAPSNEVVVVIRGSEADAHVRDGNPTNNYGANPTWDVKFAVAAGATRQAFIRFTLTDVMPTVTSAKIRLYGNSVIATKTIAVSAVSDITWTEGTGTVAVPTTTGITWNTKPTIGAQQTSLPVTTTAGFWEFDVTSYVQAQKTAGATKVTFAFTSLTQSDNGPTVFNTKENASNKPAVLISSK